MVLSLSTAYIIVGSAFCLLGAIGLLAGTRVAPALLAFPRSQRAGIFLWAGALAWFLYHLNGLSEVDLAGFPRWSLFVVFGGAGALAFKFLKDLLPLRALAVLMLFACNELLSAGFNHVPDSRVLAGTAYLLIIGALWTGASPYILRNAIEKVCVSGKRIRLAGTFFALVGIANLGALLLIK